MSSCKDCVHYEVCKDKWSYELIPIFASLSGRKQKTYMDGMEDKCQAFKPKSRFVELPCEVGQTVYVPNVEEGDWVDEYRVESFYINEKGELHIGIAMRNSYLGLLPSELGTLGFFSREEAEKALAERSK